MTKLLKLYWIKQLDFWVNALKRDFPLFKLRSLDNPRREYRRIALILKLNNPKCYNNDYIPICLRNIQLQNDHVAFFDSTDNESLQRLNFMTILTYTNKYYMMWLAFNFAYRIIPLSKYRKRINFDVGILNECLQKFSSRSKNLNNHNDDDYIKFYKIERASLPNEIFDDYCQRLMDQERILGSPQSHSELKNDEGCPLNHTQCYKRDIRSKSNCESNIPIYLYLTFEFYSNEQPLYKNGHGHLSSTPSLSSSISTKIGFIHRYYNDLWWQAALEKDFSFYHAPLRNIQDTYRRHYALLAMNMFKIRENSERKQCIVNLINTTSDFIVTDSSCVHIADILVQLLLRSPNLLIEETENKKWIMYPHLKEQNIDKEKFPSPFEFFSKKQLLPLEDQEKTKMMYNMIKLLFNHPNFPLDQVRFYFF